MTAKHSYLDWLEPRLAALGIQVVALDHGRVHAKLRVAHAGRERFVTIPVSPSDQRGVRNCLSDIKRELGILDSAAARPRLPRPRKQRAPKLVAVPLPMTEIPDPWAALGSLVVSHPAAEPETVTWSGVEYGSLRPLDPTTDPVPDWLARAVPSIRRDRT